MKTFFLKELFLRGVLFEEKNKPFLKKLNVHNYLPNLVKVPDFRRKNPTRLSKLHSTRPEEFFEEILFLEKNTLSSVFGL